MELTPGEKDQGPACVERELQRAEQLLAQACQQLREQEDQLRWLSAALEGVLAVAPPVALVDGERVRAWSDAMAERTLVPAAHAVGERLARLLASGDDQDALGWADRDGRWWLREEQELEDGLVLITLVAASIDAGA